MSSSYYCVWGSCQAWQSCCGDNVCCDITDFNAMLLTFIALGVIIIVMASCCVCFYCGSRRAYAPFLKRYFQISYTILSTRRENSAIPPKNQQADGCVV